MGVKRILLFGTDLQCRNRQRREILLVVDEPERIADLQPCRETLGGLRQVHRHVGLPPCWCNPREVIGGDCGLRIDLHHVLEALRAPLMSPWVCRITATIVSAAIDWATGFAAS
jgi:hypothetical protein